MQANQQKALLMRIARKIFEDDTLPFTASAETAPNWDSLSHLRFILEIESVFNVRFQTDQITSLATIKSINQAITDAEGENV